MAGWATPVFTGLGAVADAFTGGTGAFAATGAAIGSSIDYALTEEELQEQEKKDSLIRAQQRAAEERKARMADIHQRFIKSPEQPGVSSERAKASAVARELEARQPFALTRSNKGQQQDWRTA